MAESGQERDFDLTNCDTEPIHEIGAVQPHGMFCAVLPGTKKLCAVSENLAAFLESDAERLIGQDLARIMDASFLDRMPGRSAEADSFLLFERTLGGKAQVWAHPYWSDGVLALDLEPAAPEEASHDAFVTATSVLASLRLIDDAEELTQAFANLVRDVLGFDRTMVYRFDEEFNGSVLAEATRGELEHSFLGQMFPYTDIPAQARALFHRNRVRAIRSATSERAEIVPKLNPLTGRPFDLSDSIIRSVSPIHIRYLQNMGVTASLSISLLRKQALWGLIACHHYKTEKYIPPTLRRFCIVLCETFSQRLGEIEAERRSAVTLRKMQEINQLFVHHLQSEDDEDEQMDGLDPLAFIKRAEDDILRILEADGVCIQIGDARAALGHLPSEEHLTLLYAKAKAASGTGEPNAIVTNTLSSLDLQPLADCAGLVFYDLPLNKGFLLAVRKEQPRAVTWAGDPDKKVLWDPEAEQLHPRASFEKFQEMRRGQSLPWPPETPDLTPRLARTVLEIFIAKSRVRELAMANRIHELDEANRALDTFAYTVSHDLRSPQRAISGFSRALIEDFGEELGEEVHDYLDRIGRNAERMGQMIDDFLKMSRDTRGKLVPKTLDLSAMVEAVAAATAHEGSSKTKFEIQPRVTAYGDERMLRIVLENLIVNARRYSSRKAKPKIRFGVQRVSGRSTYFVADNGVGFDVARAEKLFEPFGRLHAKEGFPGTGIGLATVKQIISRHGGYIWVEAEPDQGATFYFTLSKVLFPSPVDA